MPRDNLSVFLAERPTGDIIPGRTLKLRTSPAPEPSDLRDGEILVEVLYLSLDPAMRGWMSDARSYMPPVQIGETMRGLTACRVLASRTPRARPGDVVSCAAGWTEYAVVPEGKFEPASHYPGLRDPLDMLSALGITSLTAWVGMTHIGGPQPGEQVVVSGAAGATGSVAGQIAKIRGATVVGICGSEAKCGWLVGELGFDVALNYKAPDFEQKFKAATKSYIDVYFDNVGGKILDMALSRAKEHARFVECGHISQYNTSAPEGPRNLSKVITMRIHMQGFVVFDHAGDFPRARRELSQWLAEGRLKKTEHVLTGGLGVAELGLVGLYNGVNTGKLIVEVKKPNRNASNL
ncbi:putative NADP-dependent oxidoreductase YfmJ [Tolypocladium ophioglossoides CBS 100239]|uniref:Dehydrogenase FUB6 n=1 Tax=Tolypocladium ophioglossoides (strain CBS 100239) TaxID=1163406 RepID=A0A0L0MZ72_TOLOC|nr:putative NADP-dependent oxidoreductase YfmJ [Tolypocladium ophioglossoides CBS 100239]